VATIFLVIQSASASANWLTQLSFLGNLLILGHNLTNIFYYPWAKKYYQGVPKLFVSSISFVVGMISFAVLSLIEAGSVERFTTLAAIDLNTPAVWLAFGYMATFGSIIGLTAYIKGQDMIESSEASFFTYLGLPVTLVLAHLLLAERLTLLQAVVVGFIVVGVIIAEKRFKPGLGKVGQSE